MICNPSAIKAVLLFALLALMIPSSSAVTPQYVFNRGDFATGNYPYDVAIADVNGDGRPDLIVPNFGDGTVSVLLGQANGLFAKQKVFPTAQGPVAVVVADFNHDGKLDLAVATSISSVTVVSILLGSGNGTFQPHVDYDVGSYPLVGLLAADFNHDGNMDLAALNYSSNTVSILLGKGDGTFAANVDYAVGSSPNAMVAQDLNHDGNVDLAVANAGEASISILLGQGDGTFKPEPPVATQSGPSALVVADFDGDKIPDLIVSHQDPPWNLTFLKGNGDGSFQAEQQVAQNQSTNQVVAADVNGDGKNDVILPSVTSGGAVVFLGKGNGTFSSPVAYTSGASPRSYTDKLAVADLNGDGHLDLAVVDEYANHITTLLGNGDGTFSPQISLPATGPTAAAIGDFNGDGIPDIALADYGAGKISVLLGAGKGIFQPPILTAGPSTSYIVAADFNGDGRLDVADGHEVFLGEGGGKFGSPLGLPNLPDSVRGVIAGDFNNDGHQDLIVLGNGFTQANPIYVYLGNGDGTFQLPKQFWSSSSIPMTLASGDFNHDGKQDLVVTLNPSGIAVMLGNGDGTFKAPVTYATDTIPNGLAVGDLNGDGIPDIIATGDLVDVFIGKGDGTFAKSVNYPGGSFPGSVVTGDFNGDGKIDIAVAAIGSGAQGNLEILLGAGNGKFGPPVQVGNGIASSLPLQAGDLNQDGTTDLIAEGLSGSMFLSTPVATIYPTALNFGTIQVGHTSGVRNVRVMNNGNSPLEIMAVSAPQNYHIVNNCGSALAARAYCNLKISFSPTSPGTVPGVLSLSDNAPGGRQNISLSGLGK